MSTTRLLASGAVARALLALTNALIGFMMMPFLVREIGEHWYGIWTAVSGVTAAYFLLDLGLSTAVTRFVTEALAKSDDERANRIVSTSFAMYSVLGVGVLAVATVAALLCSRFVAEPADVGTVRMLLMMSGASLAAGFPFKAFAGIVQARLRYDILAYWQIALAVLLALTTIALVSGGKGVMALGYVTVVGTLLSDVIFFAVSRRLSSVSLAVSYVSRETVRELFSFSIWAFMIHVSEQLRARVAPLVVGAIQNATAITHFTIGARLAETAVGFLWNSFNVIQPVLTRYHVTGEKDNLKSALLLFSKINACIGFFVTGMIIVLAERFLALWMGTEYPVAFPVSCMLSVGLCAMFVVYPLDNVLYALRKHRMLAVFNWADAVACVALGILLGRLYGVIGVALGTALPMLLTRFGLVVPYALKQAELRLSEYAGAIFSVLAVASVVMVAAGLVLRYVPYGGSYWHYAVVVIVCAVVYFPAVVFTSFAPPDRSRLVEAIRGALKLGSRSPGD